MCYLKETNTRNTAKCYKRFAVSIWASRFKKIPSKSGYLHASRNTWAKMYYFVMSRYLPKTALKAPKRVPGSSWRETGHFWENLWLFYDFQTVDKIFDIFSTEKDSFWTSEELMKLTSAVELPEPSFLSILSSLGRSCFRQVLVLPSASTYSTLGGKRVGHVTRANFQSVWQ